MIHDINVDMQAVDSSLITEIGYNAEKKVLRVKFKNGAIYDYSDFPKKMYNDMLTSESVGKYFHSRVKSIFKFIKI